MGWWKYEPARGEGVITALDVGALDVESVEPVQVWWPPQPGKPRRCEAVLSVAPAGMAEPSRVCERVGNVGSPNYKWIAYLRRAEWDEPGYAIPYMLTEVWLRERETGVERRILDYTRLSVKWTRRLKRSPTIFGVAGGFTFRYMSWSPDSNALALEDAGDEEYSRGLVVIDLQHDRILEVEGMALEWSPDGSMAVACSGNMLGCPDGMLVIDLPSGKVKHLFRSFGSRITGGTVPLLWHSRRSAKGEWDGGSMSRPEARE
ncbi:MAG: hypothetical protein KatS3mg077_2887 [Candidatus Binatia bacterium]|nr:MAG: hypothetical protein KatS3mg077_2887 [Candidatus Binatia bacterium]